MTTDALNHLRSTLEAQRDVLAGYGAVMAIGVCREFNKQALEKLAELEVWIDAELMETK